MESLKIIKSTLDFLDSCENEETRAACINSLKDHLSIVENELKRDKKRIEKYEKKLSQLVEILNPQMTLEGFEED